MPLSPELHRETMAGGQVIVENRQLQPLTSYWLAAREQILPAESRPMVCLPWDARHGGSRPRHGTSPAGRRTRVGSPARQSLLSRALGVVRLGTNSPWRERFLLERLAVPLLVL